MRSSTDSLLSLTRQLAHPEHVFDMSATLSAPLVVHRTATIRLRLTRRQAHRCYRLLRSAGDVWAWLLDSNRLRLQRGDRPLTNYQELCRELARTTRFRRAVDGRGQVGAAPLQRRLAPGRQTAQPPTTCRIPTSQAQPGAGPLLPRHIPDKWTTGAAADRQGRSGAVGAAGPADPVLGRAGAGSHLGGQWGTALAGRYRRCPRPSPSGPGACGRGGPRHHPSLRTGHRTGGSTGVRSGAPGRELPAPTRPAGPPREGGAACPQAWTAGVIGSACDVRRRAIAAVSTKPTMRPPSRRSPLLYDSRWGPCWLATPSTSPATMWAECRTCAYGNGDAPTLHRPYETRPNAPASSCGWWTSAVPPPPVRPAGNAFQSQGAVASPVRTARSKATAIL